MNVTHSLRFRIAFWSVTVALSLSLGMPASAQESSSRGQAAVGSLPNTQPLTMTGDIASQLVDGADRFLLREIENAEKNREKFWKRDYSSAEAYNAALESNREVLKSRIGLRDVRPQDTEPRFASSTSRSSLVGTGTGYQIHSVTWRSFADNTARGLLLIPTSSDAKTKKAKAQVVAIPDCGITPEQLVGLVPGVAPQLQYARRLAEQGCLVLVPMLVDRSDRLPQLPAREWIYRAGFELGRGMVAYELQEVLAAIDWMHRDVSNSGRIGVIGWGEGALLSFYAAAVDPRIDAACVSGHFTSRNAMWSEPIDRNIFGLLERFGDAELAAMVAPRALIIEACQGPETVLKGGKGAPAELRTPRLETVEKEFEKAKELVAGLKEKPVLELAISEKGQGPYGSDAALSAFLRSLNVQYNSTNATDLPRVSAEYEKTLASDHDTALKEKIYEYDRHSQNLLRDSHYVRQSTTVAQFDYSSVDAFEASAKKMREYFYEEVIGRFPNEVMPFNPRSRVFLEQEKWVAHEVVLDVYPDVFAYGLLLLPKDLKPGEKRPVVVCQHGLEGRPQDVIGEKSFDAYKAFAARLAEMGFITFAPQNLYIFTDRFRSLQRKANPLKKSLFSIITPQHQQIVDWLQTLDCVDPERIGFYGLSYGGKTAMRVPALVTDYKLSICSADFNEWVDKNASTKNPRSYTNFGEYEIFEFNLGGTFNYAEMAALIAPRGFMVERGHFDGVGDDWTVAYEYAKVRYLYASKLKIPEQTEIEWFDGPHTINGIGTFNFLKRQLNWHPEEIKAAPPQVKKD